MKRSSSAFKPDDGTAGSNITPNFELRLALTRRGDAAMDLAMVAITGEKGLLERDWGSREGEALLIAS